MKFKKEFGQPQNDKEQEIQLGMGLLNDVSKSFVVDRKEETIYIDMDRIKPNEKNEYSINDIEKLADMIKMAGGILQDIIVKPIDADGYYTITTGERRWRAAKLLRDNGEYPQELNNRVPCKIRDPQAVKLQLSDENKEDFAILVTNTQRDKTDADKYMEYSKWKKIFAELREQGVEYLNYNGYADDAGQEGSQNEKAGIQIKGRKTRDLIAEQMNVSTGQISRYEKVEKYGSPTLLSALTSDRVEFSAAEKISEMPKSEQEQLLQEFDEQEKITVQEIKEKKESKVQETKSVFSVSAEDVRKEIDKIRKAIPAEKVEMTEPDYKKYKKCIKELRNLLSR